MNAKEKYLYHQIHPFKLLIDCCAGFGSLYPFWQHRLALAFLVMLIPPPIASLLVMHFANLEPIRESHFGKYVASNMTQAMEALRLMGMAIMASGAWYHDVGIVGAGIAVILFGWLRGVAIRSA